MSRKPIQVVARVNEDAPPVDLQAWVRLYVGILARTEGLLPDPERREAA